ncbi:protein-disulfide reductase DsbD domain-containing protein [Hansschlegelia sp.]|uniref:protein-disulfide reductase DsbD domain-containing protein n=1 Tax=Hansschlegelia sp. TaxID=2041892 RepID=UPI002C103DD7|nr:protein-disulfide reductase DsbD domain-containing protein [Hansschlegelia sp.]HVI28802.1 protein-disulfide reductase DsbD domain-containing protein [Hansschlegelia sp.]
MFRSLLLPLAFSLIAAPALAEPASPWIGDTGARLRLVDGGPGDGARLAAVQITLDPGWKTYWRQPGASGVPPRFDFSGSDNLESASISYPAPERNTDEDGVTNVYHGAVTLPVRIVPRDPAAPVTLRLVADYGVCERICVPTHAEAQLELAPDGAKPGPALEEVRAAAAELPVLEPLGAKASVAIASVTQIPEADAPALRIEVAAPEGGGAPQLFAETGDGAYVAAPELIEKPASGRAAFRIPLDEPDPPATGLRLTLVAAGKAIETRVPLDAIKPRS